MAKSTKKLNLKQKESISRIIGSVLICVEVLLSALILRGIGLVETNVKVLSIYFGASVFLLAVYKTIYYFWRKSDKKTINIFNISYIVIYVLSSVCAFCTAASPVMLNIAMILCFFVPLLKRISSVLQKKTKRNVILNILHGLIDVCFIVIGFLCLDMGDLREMIVTSIWGLFLLFTGLINIALLVLSNFKIELLRKIVRKTYAGEILIGLLILMISFSIALIPLEDNIKSFGDALWYCFAIVTTIGFGDITTSTLIGRFLSIILGIYGLVVVSIITSIIVNFYNEVKSTPDDDEIDENKKVSGENDNEANALSDDTPNSQTEKQVVPSDNNSNANADKGVSDENGNGQAD